MRQPRALITAGPTREYIDPVRFLSNASSGKQGVALAEEARERGWLVELVHGPLSVAVPEHVHAHPVTTARQMLDRCLELHPECDVVIGAAAVSDFRPREYLEEKRKRGLTEWALELVPTEDILAELGKRKGDKVHVGFALETADLRENALSKIEKKTLDWVVANRPAAVGAAAGQYLLLGAGGERKELGTISKQRLARELFGAIEETLKARGPT